MKNNYESSKLEIADIFNNFAHLLKKQPFENYKVINAITNCRTSALGGHKIECHSCDYKTQAYNSCRNRHCPKCGFTKRTQWVEKRCEELLDCPYFHVVFTLPSELRPLVLQNKKLIYDLLFKASSQTLKEVAKNPKNLNADIGAIGVLHTWSQNLLDHAHVHFIVPGGGLSKDQKTWVQAKQNFLLPVRVLSKVFKAKFLDFLEEAFDNNELEFFGELDYLSSPNNFFPFIKSCAIKSFNVYCKKPFAGAEAVIKYLGQYTHRIAISNYRLEKIEDGKVYFKVRDKKDPSKRKTMSLEAGEFMRRFLLHVLPKGYVRIRHFGLLGSRFKKIKINLIMKLQGMKIRIQDVSEKNWQTLLKEVYGIDAEECPSCKSKTLVRRRFFSPLLSSA